MWQKAVAIGMIGVAGLDAYAAFFDGKDSKWDSASLIAMLFALIAAPLWWMWGSKKI